MNTQIRTVIICSLFSLMSACVGRPVSQNGKRATASDSHSKDITSVTEVSDSFKKLGPQRTWDATEALLNVLNANDFVGNVRIVKPVDTLVDGGGRRFDCNSFNKK